MKRLGLFALVLAILAPLSLHATQVKESGAVIATQATVVTDTAPTASFLPPAQGFAPGDLAVPQNSPASLSISIAPQHPVITKTSKTLLEKALDKFTIEAVAASKGQLKLAVHLFEI